MPQDLTPSLLREPLQERSRRTLERILSAGWRLLEDGGPDALTVAEITRKARTSVGSFYARFDGKDELLRYMGERTLDEAVARWGAIAEGVPEGRELPAEGEAPPGDAALRARLGPAVSGLGALYLEGPARGVALLDGVQDPEPRRRRRLEDLISEGFPARIGTSPERTGLAVRILCGTLHDAARAGIGGPAGDGSPYPAAEVLLDELTELLTGYLGGTVRPPWRRTELGERRGKELREKVTPAPPRDEAPEDRPAPAPTAEPQVAPAAAEAQTEPDPFEVWG